MASPSRFDEIAVLLLRGGVFSESGGISMQKAVFVRMYDVCELRVCECWWGCHIGVQDKMAFLWISCSSGAWQVNRSLFPCGNSLEAPKKRRVMQWTKRFERHVSQWRTFKAAREVGSPKVLRKQVNQATVWHWCACPNTLLGSFLDGRLDVVFAPAMSPTILGQWREKTM